jgi:hypothetical protein
MYVWCFGKLVWVGTEGCQQRRGAAHMAVAPPVHSGAVATPYSCAVVYKMPFKIPLKSGRLL